MTAAERKVAVLASLIVTVSVAVNLLALQGEKREVRMSRPAADGPAMVPAVAREPAATPVGLRADEAVPVQQPVAVEPPPMNMAEVVRGVQRELNTRGYEAGPPDGVAGLVTRAAIMAYEHDYGLAITARANEALLSRIVLGSSAPPASAIAQDSKLTADAEMIVRTVKELLAQLNYQPGKIDGAITPQLRRAIRDFEIAEKLPESARISGPLVSRLVRLQAAKTTSNAQGARRAAR